MPEQHRQLLKPLSNSTTGPAQGMLHGETPTAPNPAGAQGSPHARWMPARPGHAVPRVPSCPPAAAPSSTSYFRHSILTGYSTRLYTDAGIWGDQNKTFFQTAQGQCSVISWKQPRACPALHKASLPLLWRDRLAAHSRSPSLPHLLVTGRRRLQHQ